MAKKQRNRETQPTAAASNTDSIPNAASPLVIKPLHGNRNLLSAGLLLLILWMGTLGWLAWRG